jgi:hypothetical protein
MNKNNNLINYLEEINNKKNYKTSEIISYLDNNYNIIIIEDLCYKDIRTIILSINYKYMKLTSSIINDNYFNKKESIEINYDNNLYNFLVDY